MAPMRCYVNRHKSRMGGGSRFDFFMSLSPTNDMYCFTGKKQAASKGCYYSISLDQEENKRTKAATSESSRSSLKGTALFEVGPGVVAPPRKSCTPPRRARARPGEW